MIVFPFPKKKASDYDADEFVRGYCNVCGNEGVMNAIEAPLRQSLICEYCGSTNEERQIANVLLTSCKFGKGVQFLQAARWKDKRIVQVDKEGVIKEVVGDSQLVLALNADIVVLYNTLATSYAPEGYFKGIFKKLSPGGTLIFTAPFNQFDYIDKQIHVPEIKNEAIVGTILTNVFSIELVTKLARIGFVTYIHFIESEINGIYGTDAFVFEAVKPEASNEEVEKKE